MPPNPPDFGRPPKAPKVPALVHGGVLVPGNPEAFANIDALRKRATIKGREDAMKGLPPLSQMDIRQQSERTDWHHRCVYLGTKTPDSDVRVYATVRRFSDLEVAPTMVYFAWNNGIVRLKQQTSVVLNGMGDGLVQPFKDYWQATTSMVSKTHADYRKGQLKSLICFYLAGKAAEENQKNGKTDGFIIHNSVANYFVNALRKLGPIYMVRRQSEEAAVVNMGFEGQYNDAHDPANGIEDSGNPFLTVEDQEHIVPAIAPGASFAADQFDDANLPIAQAVDRSRLLGQGAYDPVFASGSPFNISNAQHPAVAIGGPNTAYSPYTNATTEHHAGFAQNPHYAENPSGSLQSSPPVAANSGQIACCPNCFTLFDPSTTPQDLNNGGILPQMGPQFSANGCVNPQVTPLECRGYPNLDPASPQIPNYQQYFSMDMNVPADTRYPEPEEVTAGMAERNDFAESILGAQSTAQSQSTFHQTNYEAANAALQSNLNKLDGMLVDEE